MEWMMRSSSFLRNYRPDRYHALPKDEQASIREACRAFFVHSLEHPPTPDEQDKLRRWLAVLDGSSPSVCRVDGVLVSSHPTQTFCVARFVAYAALDKHLSGRDDARIGDFRVLSAPLDDTVVAFVNPLAFHFRSYECLLPLDRLFSSVPMSFSPEPVVSMLSSRQAMSFALGPDEATGQALRQLDELGLYLPPLNAGSRGGRRFLFHCAALAEALDGAIRKALGRTKLKGFLHVNPVFRCNRFVPGDDAFHEHHDTPYADLARRQVSKYTLLLYITGGDAEGALTLGGEDFHHIDDMTCVLFHQSVPHEGRPYVEGKKLFLRSELIFQDMSLKQDNRIARLFSIACYMTGESMMFPALEAYANDCYERVAQAHWSGLPEAGADAPEPSLYKQFSNDTGICRFVSNGYDYWFHPTHDLQECAMVALLDAFNAELDGVAFRMLCRTEMMEESDVSSFLYAQYEAQEQEECRVCKQVPSSFWLQALEEPDDAMCCPDCKGRGFLPMRNGNVIRYTERAQGIFERQRKKAPLLLMGQELVLGPENIIVEKDKIHILSSQRLAPVHFAAMSCWDFSDTAPPDYIGVSVSAEAMMPLVPPILWRMQDGCFHLMFDFWRNNWMVSHERYHVPAPRIVRKPPTVKWSTAARSMLDRVSQDEGSWW
jgi:hypothetical protein